jgi:lambda repressor-like predicted transcriptional regulator
MEPKVWTYDDIIKALRLKGYTLSRIASELGLSYPATRYGVRHGSIESLRSLVSKVVGEPEWALWCARFPPQWRQGGPPREEG